MTVMRTYLGSLVVVLSLVACGGTSDTSGQTSGGSSAGGTGGAGHDTVAGASAGGTAGNTSGGSSSAGTGGRRDGTSGTGVGGTFIDGGTGSGGARPVDARCPAKRPMGVCSADDAGLTCQYDNFSGCLCYPNMAGTLTPCQIVDPTCTNTDAPTPAAGAAGASGKIAPPRLQICSCSASAWTCHF